MIRHIVAQAQHSKRWQNITATFLISITALISAPVAGFASDMIVNADTSLEWNQKEAFYHASGNAEALQGTQEIKADSLKAFYNPQTDARSITRIIANGDVSFSDDAHENRGQLLDYDVNSLTYLLKGPDATISGPDGTAKAGQTILFRRTEQLVELVKDAEIMLKDGRHLSGQTITIFLNDADNIDRITAAGNVTIIQVNGSTATSDEADYDRAGNKAILTGDVLIKDGETELAGERAEVDFTTGISKMLSNKSGGRVSGRFTAARIGYCHTFSLLA